MTDSLQRNQTFPVQKYVYEEEPTYRGPGEKEKEGERCGIHFCMIGSLSLIQDEIEMPKPPTVSRRGRRRLVDYALQQTTCRVWVCPI